MPLSLFARRTAALLAVLTSICYGANAQPELKSLIPSEAPAFTLLGVEPTAVASPATPADFAASLAGIIDGANTLSSVPGDFSVEVSPFWLVADPRMSWRDDVKRSVGQSLARTFTVSAATAQRDVESVSATGLAVGFSVLLRSGHVPASIVDTLISLEATLGNEAALLQRFRQPRLAAMTADHTAELKRIEAQVRAEETSALATAQSTVPPNELPGVERQIRAGYEQRLQDEQLAAAEAHDARVAELDATIESDPAYRNEYDRLVEHAQTLAKEATLRREGLHLQLSGGSAWQFAEARWDSAELDRFGIWGTVSYQGLLALTENTSLTPIGVIRYLSAETLDAEEKVGLLDLGGRFMLAGSRYTLSVESVLRTSPNEDDFERRYRIAGIAEYEVRPDVWLRASFGRDHDTVSEGNLIAQLGLALTLVEDRYTVADD